MCRVGNLGASETGNDVLHPSIVTSSSITMATEVTTVQPVRGQLMCPFSQSGTAIGDSPIPGFNPELRMFGGKDNGWVDFQSYFKSYGRKEPGGDSHHLVLLLRGWAFKVLQQFV